MIDFILALLKGLLGKIVAEEFAVGTTALARWIVKRSAGLLGIDRERYKEQWLADLENRKTPLRKLTFAIGIVRAAGTIELTTRPVDEEPVPDDVAFGPKPLGEVIVYGWRENGTDHEAVIRFDRPVDTRRLIAYMELLELPPQAVIVSRYFIAEAGDGQGRVMVVGPQPKP